MNLSAPHLAQLIVAQCLWGACLLPNGERVRSALSERKSETNKTATQVKVYISMGGDGN